MSLDAIRALSGVGDSYGNELLGLLRERAICEDNTAECLERVVDLWRKFLSPSGDLRCGRVIHRFGHR